VEDRLRHLLRYLLRRIFRLRTVATGTHPTPAPELAEARRRHALRVRDETLARVTFGIG